MAFPLHSHSGAARTMAIIGRPPPVLAADRPVTTSNPGWNGGGAPAVGDHLSGSAGSWSGDGLTYTYQWMRCDTDGLGCVPIPDATNLDYAATTADVGHTLAFCVTARNSGGSATSCSPPTPAVVASHPAPTPSPSSGGAGGDGDATPASPG